MIRPRAWSLYAACVFIGACGESSDAPRNEATQVAESTTESAEPAEPAAEGTRAPAPRGAAETTTALRQARELARADRFAEAFATLAPLVAEDARGNPAFECEAGYIAYRAGNLAEATRLVRSAADAYSPPTDRAGRESFARCLYNVGLVYEAADDLPSAIAAYQRSFSLRANRTVYDHLASAAVRADAASDDALTQRVTEAVARAVGPAGSFDELARGLTEYCEARPYHPETCTAVVHDPLTAPSGGTGLRAAAIIRTVWPETEYLAVDDGGGARLVGAITRPSESDAEITISSMRFEEIVPPAGLELAFDVSADHMYSDYPGNDCDSEEPGCDGATHRDVRRARVVCSSSLGTPQCIRIPTMEVHYMAWGMVELPCDRDEGPPYGIGFEREVRFDAEGRATATTPRALSIEAVACDDAEAEGVPENVADRPRDPRALAAMSFADLARTEALPRTFPQVPVEARPRALAFAAPWGMNAYYYGAPLEGALDELIDSVGSACRVIAEDASPRCCPYEGSCHGALASSVRSGSTEVALIDVTCAVTMMDAEDATHPRYRVLTMGEPDGNHTVIALIDSTWNASETLPAVRELRVEDALHEVDGPEVRFWFESVRSAPAMDSRTRIEARNRSTTRVEVLCTSGDTARCHALPTRYDGVQLAAAEDGRTAVIGTSSYAVTIAPTATGFAFSDRRGAPPVLFDGTRSLGDLHRWALPRWGEPN